MQLHAVAAVMLIVLAPGNLGRVCRPDTTCKAALLMPAQHWVEVSLPVKVVRCLPTVVCLLSLADANSRCAGGGMASAALSRLHWACILLPLPAQADRFQSVMAVSWRR